MPSSDTIIRRKPLKSISGYPYRPARIVNARTCHIVFYAWDVGREALVRKRVLHDELAECESLAERQRLASEAIEEINWFLKRDWHLCSTPSVPREIKAIDFSRYSVIEALNYAVDYKKDVEGVGLDSIEKYKQLVKTVVDFLEFKKLKQNYPLRHLNNAFINQYFEYVKIERRNSNKTYNDKKGSLHALANVLLRQDPKLFQGINPFSKIRKLQTQARKHAAFTDDQLKGLIALAEQKGWHQIALFIRYMYYTLARPKELACLKVGHHDLKMRKLLITAESSKTNIEEYVGINDRLAEVIREAGVLAHPQQYYVFSNRADGYRGPGETKVGKNYFYKRISELIDELGYYDINPNHTPYSIKHTGAIALYMATRNIKVVQYQCRHTNLETTIKYLRDLGVFTDFDEINKMKAVI